MLDGETKNPNLKHNKALYEQRLIRGVPSKIFLCAMAIVVVALVTAGFVPAVVVFLIVIPPLIIIHKNDEKALSILFDKLKRPDFYSAGGVDDEKALKVLKKRNETFLVKSISEIS